MSKLKVDQISSVSETGSLQLSGNVKPDFSSSNTGLVPPSGTTDQREASPMMGSIRMNTETKILEYYDGTIYDDPIDGSIDGSSDMEL